MKTKHLILIGLGVALWLGENIAFGWNAKPESSLEATLDTISLLLVAWGIIGDLLTGVELHKHHTINTQDMNYYDQRGAKEKTNYNVNTEGKN